MRLWVEIQPSLFSALRLTFSPLFSRPIPVTRRCPGPPPAATAPHVESCAAAGFLPPRLAPTRIHSPRCPCRRQADGGLPSSTPPPLCGPDGQSSVATGGLVVRGQHAGREVVHSGLGGWKDCHPINAAVGGAPTGAPGPSRGTRDGAGDRRRHASHAPSPFFFPPAVTSLSHSPLPPAFPTFVVLSSPRPPSLHRQQTRGGRPAPVSIAGGNRG